MNFFEILFFAVNAVLPIVLLILIGYLLKKFNFVNDSFISVANKMVFRVVLPVMLFLGVYRVDDLSSINWNIAWFAVGALITIFFLALISVTLFTKNNRQKGVVLQAAVRCNFAIIGIPLVGLLAANNPEALTNASILVLFAVTTSNILSIIALSIFPKGEIDINGNPVKQKINWGTTLLKIVKNPLIIGILLGLTTVLIRPLFYPFTIREGIPFIYTTADILARMATPLALITLGAAFKFSSAKRLMGQIIHGTLWRVVLVPGIMITLAVIFREQLGFDENTFPALIALFGAPIAVTSVVMALELDNDEELAAQLVVWTSIVSIVTIFTIVVVLKSLGIF